MSDRREFLKLFGVGAAVVPIIGGVPFASAESKIIEAPKVELVKPTTFGPTDWFLDKSLHEPCATTIIFEREGGRRYMLHGRSCVLQATVYTAGLGSRYQRELIEMVPKHRELKYTLTGQFFTDATRTVVEITEL